MNFVKKLIINYSSNGVKYSNLIFENSIHNFDNIDTMLKDYDYLNSIFSVIFYGNFISRCKKKHSITTRLNNIQESECHQIASEFEKFQRINYHFEKILGMCLIVNFLILINMKVSYIKS